MPTVPAKEYRIKPFAPSMGPKTPIPGANVVLGQALALQKQRRAGRQPADGALHRTTAFAKEHWILKDWKSLSGGFRGRSPYLNIVDTYKLLQDYERWLPKVQGGHGGPPPWEFWLLLFLQK